MILAMHLHFAHAILASEDFSDTTPQWPPA
jgi:hypothetical protein